MIDYDKQDTPVEVYLSRLTTAGARRSMRNELDKIARFMGGPDCNADALEWHRLRIDHALKIRNWLIQNYKHTTANKAMYAFRGVLKCAWRLGLMDGDEFFAATDFARIRGQTKPEGRMITDAEIAKLLDCCGGSDSANLRDRALIALMYATGARRDEIVGMKIVDYDPIELFIMVRKGKGRKERQIFLGQEIADVLDAWLVVRGDVPDEPLFCRVYKGGFITDKPLTGEGIHHILGERANEAGVTDITPHDFRRTFISSLIDKGVDLSTVSKLAGHANIQDTLVYDRRNDDALRKAANMVSLPTNN